MVKKKKTGLGRGLDSLIPVIPEDDESEENSSMTLEDMLKEKDEEDTDSKKTKEKKNDKKSKSKKTTTKKSKTTSNEVATEDQSISELIEDNIEVEAEIKSSQTSKKTDQSISETPVAFDTENIETQISQPVAIKDEVAEIADLDETKQNVSGESEKAVEDISNNLTEREKQSIDEVIKIIAKNPRITLWSAKSAAVFRYLRKTEPEFSISKEASKLIDEAVQSKYPEIWALFKDIEK